MTKPSCPPLVRLLRLDLELDRADDPNVRALEIHVEQCPDCQEALERLARSDPEEDQTGPSDAPSVWSPVPGFSIVRELGRGGGGVVYEAIQEPIGRRVALKFLNVRSGLDPIARHQWLREARILGSVRHPAIVRLHDVGDHDGRLFLVLDLVEGGSVQDRLGQPPAPRIAARLIAQVALAVAELHRLGIAHLDIKPSNILIDGPRDGGWSSPVLADFGIARHDEDTLTGSLLTGTRGPWGTPAYMAPEQVSGRRRSFGPSADVFALGATLYALLTGNPPFQSATVLETLDRLRRHDPTPPSRVVPGLSRELETICLTCLNKDPNARYRSADALAEDLERWLSGRRIQARSASHVELAWRWSRRYPLAASLSLSLAIVLITGLTASTVLWRRADSQRRTALAVLERAQAGESAAVQAITTLTSLLVSSIESPEHLASERTAGLLPGVLGLTETVRGAPEVLATHVGPIASLELRIAILMDRQVNFDAMRALLDDGVRLFDTIPPRSDGDDRIFASLLLHRASLSSRQGRSSAAIDDTRAAIAVLGPHASDEDWTDLLTHLDGIVRELTDQADGTDPTAELLAEEYLNRFMRPAAPPQWVSQAAQGRPGTESAASLLRQVGDRTDLSTPSIFALTDTIARELADWAEQAKSVQLDDQSLGKSARLDLESWDHRLNRSDLSSALMERIGQQGMVRAIAHRHAGRWAEARQIIRWMRNLGLSLAAADPDRPGTHLLIARAFEQEGRLNDRLGDRAGAESAWRRALQEVTAAHEQAPDDLEVRQNLAEIRESTLRMITGDHEP